MSYLATANVSVMYDAKGASPFAGFRQTCQKTRSKQATLEAVMHLGVSSCQISRCEAFNSPQITQIQQIYADFLDKSKLFQ
jgi:hypothetical protein